VKDIFAGDDPPNRPQAGFLHSKALILREQF
jgi:hypothetical protein